MSALVLDGHLKSALSCVRSLGEKEIEVACAATRSSAMCLHSRFCSQQFTYASPKTHQKKFTADVCAMARAIHEKSGEKPVIFCFSDATLLSLAQIRAQLNDHAIVLLPEESALETASSKAKTYALAQSLSIPTITTYAHEAFDMVSFPAVVKNQHSIVWNEGKSEEGSATFVCSLQELKETYEAILRKTHEAPLVQACIKGDEYGVEMVCDHGEALALFAHKRIRSLSPKGGAAVVKEAAAHTQEVVLMEGYARALVQELSWHGAVMVEFKVNSEDGRVLLMEINGRFWGSLPLAVKAGVDFPYCAYALARGEQTLSAFAPAALRTRHFLGDCRWLLRVLFARDKMRRHLYPSRMKAVRDFATEVFKSEGDIFDIDDMQPSIFEYIDACSNLNRQKQ